MYSSFEEAENAISGLEALGYSATYAKVREVYRFNLFQATATPAEGTESFTTQLQQLQDHTSTNLYLSNIPVTMNSKVLFFINKLIIPII